ncbi:MAG: DUF1320 domain-containing protein [bacterium]|nr:DUF1320 domain-containing protein [bacterium]
MDTLAGLGDKVNRPGDLEDSATIANINGAIQRADELIDSYIRGVYNGVLPLASVPGVIRGASAEIAGYLLWQSTNVPDDKARWRRNTTRGSAGCASCRRGLWSSIWAARSPRGDCKGAA